MISQTFLFEYRATCNDGFYVCNVKTTLSNGTVLETAIAEESPILEGCESMYYGGGGGGGGVSPSCCQLHSPKLPKLTKKMTDKN